ncbi:unnamed protein product, partial [Musa textilis]
ITHEFQPHKYITLAETEMAPVGHPEAPDVVGRWPHLAPNRPLAIYIFPTHLSPILIEFACSTKPGRGDRSIMASIFGLLQNLYSGERGQRRLRRRLPSALRSPPPSRPPSRLPFPSEGS